MKRGPRKEKWLKCNAINHSQVESKPYLKLLGNINVDISHAHLIEPSLALWCIHAPINMVHWSHNISLNLVDPIDAFVRRRARLLLVRTMASRLFDTIAQAMN